MWVDPAYVMDVIVKYQIVMIDVLGSGTVAAEQNSGSAYMVNMIVLDPVLLPIKVYPDCPATTVNKVAMLDHTILGSAQAN